LVFASEGVDAGVYQALSRWHLVPWVQRIYPGKKYTLWRIQRQPAPLKPLRAVGGIPIFGGLAAIFAGLEFAGLLYLMRFAGESPGYASLKSGLPKWAAEWDLLVAVHIRQTYCTFRCPKKLLLRKMMFELNR
jgi:hypothetical protein